jgi:hypothetical protein
MNDLEEGIENPAPESEAQWSEETTARYHAILMSLLDDTKREFDQWPKWKKQYSITSRAYTQL